MDQLKIEDLGKNKKFYAIDKVDKPGFGLKGVKDLLGKERVDQSGAITKGANLNDEQLLKIIDFLKIKDVKELKKINNPLTNEGIKELEDLFEILSYGEYSDQVKFNSLNCSWDGYVHRKCN